MSFDDVLELEEFEVRKYQHELRNAFKKYLTVGEFPEWFEVKNQLNPVPRWFVMLIEDIPKKAIFEDIAILYEIRNAKALEQILAFLVAHQSRILSYATINDVVKLDRSTLLNYLEFLKSSYLIAEVLKYAGIKEQMKAKKKFKKSRAILITKNLYGQEEVNGGKLHFIPAEVFLMVS